MKRGNLVIYDLTGRILAQTGEAEGDVYPHEYPVGVPYIEIPHGAMELLELTSIDTSVEPHLPVFKHREEPVITDVDELQLENARLKAQLEALTGN